jgi:hypothetical protein
VEWAVRALYLLSLSVLSLAYVAAWFQYPIAANFEWASPFLFHLATAGISVLLSFFANLSVLFYFIGTGVWMKDQAKLVLARDRVTAQAVWAIYEKSNRLKARAFPFATFSIFFGILTFVMGGAFQVGAVPPWVHPTLASLLCLSGWLGIKFIFGAMRENLANLNECSALLADKVD